jgi:Mg-chelatase subunit ChlD
VKSTPESIAIATALSLSLALSACAGIKADAPGTGSAGATPAAAAGTTGGGTGTGGTTGTGSAGTAASSSGAAGHREINCGLQTFDLVRKPADVLLVLDRSASMKDPPSGATASTTKWDLTVPAITEVIAGTSTALSWGMKSFPEGEGAECVAGSVTPKIDVPIAPANATAVNAAVNATLADGNGTPTGDAIKQAVAYLKMLPNDHARYILLATDGEPSCPKPTDTARMYAVQSITEAAAAGFHTFVVGVATTKATATTVLNQMAIAGLEPRGDLNPAATRFFLANTKEELVTSLKVITGQIPNCLFPLATTPPVPENIAVKVSGTKAPRDPSHTDGWDYTGPDFSAVAVYGSWCQMIQTSAADMVQIVYGCKDIVIP